MSMPSNSPSSCSLSISGNSGQTQSAVSILGNSSTTSRRKSSLSYQHQLQAAADYGHDYGNSAATGTSSPNRFSPHPSESLHQIGDRLSLHPMDRYDETITCLCIPPPSPAPTSDRFVIGMPSPSPSSSITTASSSHQYGGSGGGSSGANDQSQSSAHKYAGSGPSLHRTMSPNSLFRMSDRYRSELSPKCHDRYVTNTHFLANSTPLLSNDAYTYLASTVHTPVKRYVPTPPPPTEIYSDIQQSSSSTSSSSGYHTIGNSPHLPHQQQQQQQVSQPPYRFRMKCCLTDQPAPPSSLPMTTTGGHVSDPHHYATPPRVRPFKCPANSGPNAGKLSAISIQQTASSQTHQVLGPHGGLNSHSSASCAISEYLPRTPSVEYLGSSGNGGRVSIPVSVMSEPTTGTCLHCNTIRRTTGVHQTTQTTGPISPVPQQTVSSIASNLVVAMGQHGAQLERDMSASMSTPSTSHTSPLSPPPPTLQQQQQARQRHQSEQMICSQQQQQQNTSAVLTSQMTRSMQQQQPSAQHYIQQQPPPPLIPLNNAPQHSAFANRHHHIITSNCSSSSNNNNNNGANNLITSTPQRGNTLNTRQQMQQRFSHKQRIKEYVRKEIAKFFGVDGQTEEEERVKWSERQRRLAVRRFGPLKSEMELNQGAGGRHGHMAHQPATDRPDILPAQTEVSHVAAHLERDHHVRVPTEKKASVPTMLMSGLSYVIHNLNKRQQRYQQQWSRSFAPAHISAINGDNPGDVCEGLNALQEEEIFFDSIGNDLGGHHGRSSSGQAKLVDHSRQIYMGERVHGWRTSAVLDQQHMQANGGGGGGQAVLANNVGGMQQRMGYRGTRISSQILDGVLENSRRPIARKVKLFHRHELDDRNDHRPFFTYWINTVQILVLTFSLICYGIGPIGFGVEQKTGQVLVTSLSLQTVQHQEQRNVWIGPRGNDLVHLGAKFATCMRRDIKIMDVLSKTRRQERETACCIRNDDSGCVQSSQADCSVRGLWPTKSISTWKKWSPGDSGPGGRISGSVCGLDPKYCDAPASIAPFEWPDDITKWPICRKTNSFSQRFRFKDHTAEHMVCEVIGHPCCTGVFGECRITTREYCDFVNGYFHEEASLCSQISCLINVCGMFPFLSIEVPDQFYRLFTSLCLHAGILHLAITIAFQHILLADLERLIGPIRTAIVYICSGLAGNLTSAILVPYKPEVGPLASLAGVVSSLVVLLILMHWRELRKPYIALFKLIMIVGLLFGIGTLPWQQNFAGLIAGIFCGIFLTIALVPFVSVAKYGRKAKVNLIWTCIIFHMFIYTIMFVIFYIFPNELTSFNFGDVLSDSFNSNGIEHFATNNHIHMTNHHHQQQQPPQQQHHHHHSDDIMSNSGLSDDMDADSDGTVSETSPNGNIISFNAHYGLSQPSHKQLRLQPHERDLAFASGSTDVKCLNRLCDNNGNGGGGGGGGPRNLDRNLSSIISSHFKMDAESASSIAQSNGGRMQDGGNGHLGSSLQNQNGDDDRYQQMGDSKNYNNKININNNKNNHGLIKKSNVNSVGNSVSVSTAITSHIIAA